MIPKWFPGAAARDAMIRRSDGRGGSPSRDGVRGVLSFVGIFLIAAATFAQAMEAHWGGFLACMVAVLIVVAAWWAAYQAHGTIGVAAGVGISALAGYALYSINAGSGGGSWFWPFVVFIGVGIDQWALKSAKY